METSKKELPPHMVALLAKCRAYDEKNQFPAKVATNASPKFVITDVTPAGYGPND